MFVDALVEGIIDEAAARRIITAAGHEFGTCYGKRGCGYIKTRIVGFNNAAHTVPILALVDQMDTRLLCPPQVISDWLPYRQPLMLLRLAVREL